MKTKIHPFRSRSLIFLLNSQMRCALFIALCFSFSLVSVAQSTDSLWLVWNDETNHDTTRITALNNYAWDKYLFTQPDSAFYYSQIARDFGQQKNLPKHEANALHTQGISFAIRGDYPTAIEYTKEALEIRKRIGDAGGIRKSYINLGNLYDLTGRLDEAIEMNFENLDLHKDAGETKHVGVVYGNIAAIMKSQGRIVESIAYYDTSLTYFEKLNDQKGIVITKTNIGNIYADSKQNEEALKYYMEAYEIQKELDDPSNMARILNNIGSALKDLGREEEALNWLNQSLEVSRSVGNEDGEATALRGLGTLHLKAKEYNLALEKLLEALDKDRAAEDLISQAYGLVMISRTYLAMGKTQLAQKHAQEALNLASSLKNKPNERRAYDLLYKSYKKNGNWRNALEMYERSIEIRDSLQNDENERALIRQQFDHAYQQKAAVEKAKAEQAQKIADAKLLAEKAQTAQQKQLNLFLYIALGLAVLVGIFVFNRFAVTRRQKRTIEKQKVVVEEQKQQVEHAYEQLEEKNQEIMDSIQYAKRLQTAILPPQKLVKEWLPQSFILYKPKDIVAGDFYWMETVGDTVYFAAADCTGHGVPGAMVSVVCSNALTKALIEENITDTGKILDRTRELVIERFGKSEEEVKDGMDVALCALNTNNNQLSWAGANNPLWIIRNGQEEVEELKADKQPIGKYSKEDPFTSHQIELQKGDSFYVFSDGYPDQFGGEKGKKYKSGKMKKFLVSIQSQDMTQQRSSLDAEFEAWRGDIEQIDDVCIIGVQV